MTSRIEPPKPQTRFVSLFAASAAVITVAALAVRVAGALNDLWLDEILAVNMAGQVSSPIDVFLRLHNEVNHHLYTLYLTLLGSHETSLAYRLPSLAAGSGTVVLAGLIGRVRGNVSAILAMILVGFSYLLILYSSEARGYALAVFFSFLCFWALHSHFAMAKPWPAWVFAIGAVLGILSQVVFVCFYLAALLWTAVRWSRSGLGRRQAAIAAIRCHALPLCALAIMYVVDLRFLVNVGGTASTSVLKSHVTSLAWALGAPAVPALGLVAILLALMAVGAGTYLLWRAKSDTWIFFPAVILVFPILLVLARSSMTIYVRYFIVGAAFLLLLCGFVLASLYNRGPGGRALCVLLLTAYLLGNGWHISQLVRHGRGQYREAIRFMSQHSADTLVTIGSDHDFRNGTILGYYAPTAMLPKQGLYVLTGNRPPQGPEWVIRHKESFDAPTPPDIELKDGDNNRYDLEQSFPSAPLSGLHWFIYHNRSKSAAGRN